MTLKQEMEDMMKRAEHARSTGRLWLHKLLMRKHKALEERYLRLRAKGKHGIG